MSTVAAPAPTRLWIPGRDLVTRSAAQRPYAQQVLGRLASAGVDDVEFLRGDRLRNLRGDGDRAAFLRAKNTLALVVGAPSRRRLQPIPPSADWRVDLAEGCPAHCQYCYLAGSLSGPPVTRVFADLDDVLTGLDAYVGRGAVTSGTADRGREGTTFEASCYTDPLALEHLTGGLATAITHFGTHDWAGPVQLRATTKFADVASLLDLPHPVAVLPQRGPRWPVGSRPPPARSTAGWPPSPRWPPRAIRWAPPSRRSCRWTGGGRSTAICSTGSRPPSRPEPI
jgi:spore photoproduct lyase